MVRITGRGNPSGRGEAEAPPAWSHRQFAPNSQPVPQMNGFVETDHNPGGAEVAFRQTAKYGRDLRLDAGRGLALWFIFLDHVPDNHCHG